MAAIGVSKVLAILGLVIVTDFITGLFAAKLNKDDVITSTKWNDGLIRKGNMIFAAFACLLFDLITGIDILPYIPFSEFLNTVGFVRIGICEAVSIGLICGEIRSIAENWEKSGLQLPGFIKSFIVKISNLFSK